MAIQHLTWFKFLVFTFEFGWVIFRTAVSLIVVSQRLVFNFDVHLD